MSRRFPHFRRGHAKSLAALAVAGLFVTGLSTPAAQANPRPESNTPAAADDGFAPGAIHANGPEVFSDEATGLADLDTRGKVSPLSSQRTAVPAGATVRWNRYGTPASLINHAGYLSSARDGSAAAIAKSWLLSHAALFGLSRAQVDGLTLVSDHKLMGSQAHAVLFRQQFGTLTSAVDGMATVGVTPRGQVAYVSSSLARTSSVPPTAGLSAVSAWTIAVSELRSKHALSIPAAPDLSGLTTKQAKGWTTFKVPGFAQTQQARLRALAKPSGAVVPVFEVNVVNSARGSAAAYTSFVDAVSGDVLIRQNRTNNLSTIPMTSEFSEPFQGTFTATKCGPDHDYTVDGATKSIIVVASAVAADEDIVLKLLYQGAVVASSDTATSPEAITYSPAGGVPAGKYTVQVCPFNPNPTAPVLVGQYVGQFTATEQETPQGGLPYPPKWKYFLANPTLNFSASDTTDNRKVGCWVKLGGGCDTPPSPLNNSAARAPWDYDPRLNAPTNTTSGNAADTAEAWASPLTPGGLHQMPVSPNRHYGYDNPLQDFTDSWNNNKCGQASFTPAKNNNDILASVTNLFSGHNRFHDYSYFLGFTEGTYNLQDSNFGNRAQGGVSPTGGEGDPEIGNVQAGALSGGQPSFLGRDNANQITLQDGVPGITNQYLFQPIAGAFYAPCVDGDFDAPVYGHEYTHAITNRMVAGPDAGLSGFQAGSMGESWSDLVALEYLFEHSYDIGTRSPWVEGPYVTGNKVTGIRNYALDNNPLQYGDLGYDITGPEVHADGEVWNTAMFDVRRELVKKYNATFPESDKALQLRCSDGAVGVTANSPRQAPLPANQCPGGRRWIQLMFDSYLLQQSATSMLDARDAYLAADRMRFGGSNQAAIWQGFASDGMGQNASTKSTEDDQPTPDYTSPFANEGTFRLGASDLTSPVKGKLYVGDYEARVTPIADTDSSTSLPSAVRLVPGTYHFVFQADGYGLKRFSLTIQAGKTTSRVVHLATNVASFTKGARIEGFGPPESMNTTKLIDDTEASNWAGKSTGVSVDTSHPFVNVNLAGDRARVIRAVKVSALLRPADPKQDESEPQPDMSSGSRFTALRKFAIEICTTSASSDCKSLLPSGAPGSPYERIYTSPSDAFNGVRPRPLAPALLLKQFDIPDRSATHVRLVALENQCTGQRGFAGEQDNDLSNNTDCKSGSTRDESVRAAELEVFGYDAQTRPPGDPVVLMTMTGKPVASAGEQVTYKLSYTNYGPKPSSNADIRIAQLPSSLRFLSASGDSQWSSTTRSLRYKLGTVPVGVTRSVTLTTRVAPGAPVGSAIITTAQFAGAMTYSPPAAAVTLVGP